MNKEQNLNFLVPFGKRLLLFIFITCIGYFITGALGWFITWKTGGNSIAAMRILAVLQDIFLFILPAVGTAVIITRLPADFLCLTKMPRIAVCLLACLILLTAMPALNGLIAWNEQISLPESMSAIEKTMRGAEDLAQKSVGLLLAGDSAVSLIVSVMIVGVLAGFSEEIFFRGGLQRLLMSNKSIRPVQAIVITAFIFSFIHFQFYGFFPRFVLGLYFGFLLYLTKSLWIPAIVHAFNNTLYILGTKLVEKNPASTDINTVGADNTISILLSILISAILLKILINVVSKGNTQSK